MWLPNIPVTLLSSVAATAGIAALYKDYKSSAPYDKKVRAEDKTVIITGANSGIGREAAWEFAKRGAKVFMACRDMDTCEEARRSIVLETNNKFVYCRPCDLASLESVADFVKRFKSEEPYVDVLINNAAVMEAPRGVTKDGFETHLGVNHLGHFLLTNLLIDTLKESAPSRVIVVTCKDHLKGAINKEDLNHSSGKYDARAAYTQSKLANVLFANELSMRLAGSKVTVHTVDPGLADTELTRHLPVRKSWTRFLIYPLFWPLISGPRLAAQPLLHVVLDSRVGKTTGCHYVGYEVKEPSPLAADFELAQWLWLVSEKWTRLDQHRANIASKKEGAHAA